MQHLLPRQRLHPSLPRILLRPYSTLPKTGFPPLLPLPPLALHLPRHPTSPRHHTPHREHHQWRKFATYDEDEREKRDLAHVCATASDELELRSGKQTRVHGGGEGGRGWDAGEERPCEGVVCVDGFETSFVETEVGAAEGEVVVYG